MTQGTAGGKAAAGQEGAGQDSADRPSAVKESAVKAAAVKAAVVKGGAVKGGAAEGGAVKGGAAEGGAVKGTADQETVQRREQLLRAALEVIASRGYADTRIADVAEHAGISPALVIYYFKTRDTLLTEALRYSQEAWYAAGTQRLATIPSAAGQLSELIAMTCLPDTDPGTRPGRPTEWLLWLDLWALSARNAGVAAVRRTFDQRWRQAIETTVLAGQQAGEFSAEVDATGFTITLSALLDGLAVQIALEDPDVPPARAYDLATGYAAGQLGFSPSRRS